MNIVLVLLLVNAVLGTIDTLWYHEYKAKLPSQLAHTRTELKLHAARDAIYVVIYGVLAWWIPNGLWAFVFAALLASEAVITLADFVVEDRDRPAIGGIAPGERILHTLMAIVYGAMLASLLPILADTAFGPTMLSRHAAPIGISWLATATAGGIAATGIRDLVAVCRPNDVRFRSSERATLNSTA